MEKNTFLFNEASKAYWNKLKPEQQEYLVQADIENNKQKDALREDHAANRDQQVTDTKKALGEHNKAQFNMQRPPWVPPPKLKTDAELQEEAECKVDKAYTVRLQKLETDHKEAERSYIKHALGIEPPSPDRSDHGIDRN